MIIAVYSLQLALSSATTAAGDVCAHASPTAEKVGEAGYCALYQADKPIRGTTIDMNLSFLHLSTLSKMFFIKWIIVSVMTHEKY